MLKEYKGRTFDIGGALVLDLLGPSVEAALAAMPVDAVKELLNGMHAAVVGLMAENISYQFALEEAEGMCQFLRQELHNQQPARPH